MNCSKYCTLLLLLWQLANPSSICASDAETGSALAKGNAIFLEVAAKYRDLDRLRLRGKVEILFQNDKETEAFFEIAFSRGKELCVKTRSVPFETPANGAFEKDFRIWGGQAHEYLFGIETHRHDTSPEEFVKTKVFHYSLIPATLPALLLRDDSAFFGRHIQPVGWTIQSDENPSDGEVAIKRRWAKGDTTITVRSSDKRLLTCRIQFRTAGLQSAFFTFEDDEEKVSGTEEPAHEGD
ncbi:hypothetical protein [Allorhodopirellula solitaria]|uniref:Uncharacterized protein n=1 Tax=Allorhodopirellula solitaria TaxID=2527987 RepID=A0A5C5WZ82_9BACT|nr:hypothetical protein [Allorhodopirellula solitaria]TWT55956.1 hypothetical protein CA85_46640 [Allorhodopirellula solitaria]